jgi:hypothetical protein
MQNNTPLSYLPSLKLCPTLWYLCLKLAIATFKLGHSTNPNSVGKFRGLHN